MQKGSKMSEESKRKISKALKGKKHSKETCKNISKSRIGKKHSIETKMKISKAHLGKKISKETKKKMSESRKKLKMSNTIGDGCDTTLHNQARHLFGKDYCEHCNIHIDEYKNKYKSINNFDMHNTINDYSIMTKEAWITLCRGCHIRLHKQLKEKNNND